MPLIIKKPTFMNGGQVYGHPPPPPPPSLGDEYCGGYYIGTTTSLDGSSYYLIVAPNATGCTSCQWKTTTTTTSGLSTDGYSNTYVSLANSEHPAGNWTATRTINGFTDWYLPASGELQTMYVNDGNLPAGEGFRTGSFDYYWSSNQSDAYKAAARLFIDGKVETVPKLQTRLLRAVRRVPV